MNITNDSSSDDKFNFEAISVGNYIRIYPASFRDKMFIHEHFQQNNIQHYIIPNGDAPLKLSLDDSHGTP